MVVRFNQPVSNIKTIDDYKMAKQAFELDKQMKQAQVQEAMFKASPEGRTTSAPAALQVNDAIQKALDVGDYDTANRIAWLQRSSAYGIDTFGRPQGSTPETFKPFKPKERPVQAQETSEYVPTGQTIMSGSSIAEQQARNAALKKGAETEAQLQQELEYEPIIEEKRKAALEKATREAEKQKEVEAGKKTMPLINELRALNESTQQQAYSSIAQPFRRLTPGTSPEEASFDLMKQARLSMAAPLAKQLGVNPTDKDFQATLDSIFDIDASKESRALQIEALADRISRRQNQIEGKKLPEKSGARQKLDELQGKQKNETIENLIDKYGM